MSFEKTFTRVLHVIYDFWKQDAFLLYYKLLLFYAYWHKGVVVYIPLVTAIIVCLELHFVSRILLREILTKYPRNHHYFTLSRGFLRGILITNWKHSAILSYWGVSHTFPPNRIIYTHFFFFFIFHPSSRLSGSQSCPIQHFLLLVVSSSTQWRKRFG